MGRKPIGIALAAMVGGMAAAAGVGTATATEKPRLILAVTIDGLRGDIPFRMADRFGPDGFRYLRARPESLIGG